MPKRRLPNYFCKCFLLPSPLLYRRVEFSSSDLVLTWTIARQNLSSGERTFLQWMHAGILLAGISMGLSSHVDTGSTGDWIAVLLLPVAIGIMVHAMAQCKFQTPWICYTAKRFRNFF